MICAVIALIACFDMPIGYYTFLRMAITIGAILVLFKEVQKDVNLFGITFICLAILFNPIIPIYLYKKSIWMSIDISTGFIFLIYGFKEN